ncbi:hypothetical protein FAZ15_03375 [Sphingobacterium olei]|uniref:Signal transduction histidine kinase internal region domain-containing protein n=1 Tax=Sphingobacterium olei TaxID=2571155 RepID=A0A4U0P928_9SPHI|nr:hypothetical protein [Sphingobacterium olei]TJZ63332.1 hypothetical protein FAZ15_03375 [Sphingobacterium olei]
MWHKLNAPYNKDLYWWNTCAIALVYSSLYFAVRHLFWRIIEKKISTRTFIVQMLLLYGILYMAVLMLLYLLPRSSTHVIYKSHLPIRLDDLLLGTIPFFVRYSMYAIFSVLIERHSYLQYLKWRAKRRLASLKDEISATQRSLHKNELQQHIRSGSSHGLGNLLQELYDWADPGKASALPHMEVIVHYLLVGFSNYEQSAYMSLQREIDMVSSLAALYDNKIRGRLGITVEGKVAGRKIPRFLLLSLAHDIVKHADWSSPHCLADMQIRVTDEKFVLHIRNTRAATANWHTGHDGTGLQRLRDNLDALHPGQYLLHHHIDENLFDLHLEIHY